MRSNDEKKHYMTRDERAQLEALQRNRIPVSEIARQLGFCRQTIYDELKRGAYIHTCLYWDKVLGRTRILLVS